MKAINKIIVYLKKEMKKKTGYKKNLIMNDKHNHLQCYFFNNQFSFYNKQILKQNMQIR